MHRALAAVLVALLAALVLPVTPVAAATQAEGRGRGGAGRQPQRALQGRRERHRHRGEALHAATSPRSSRPTRPGRRSRPRRRVRTCSCTSATATAGPASTRRSRRRRRTASASTPRPARTAARPSTTASSTSGTTSASRRARSSCCTTSATRPATRSPGCRRARSRRRKERVDNYGAGFIGAGARAVFAEGHPSHPAISYMRQLFTTDRSMATIFRTVPTWHDNLYGPYASQRTPGVQYQLDTDTATPSGFYRSLIGDLSLTASKVTRTAYPNTGAHPADFVLPGAAEVTATEGAPLFATAEAAADPLATSSTTLPLTTRLRVDAEAAPALDGDEDPPRHGARRLHERVRPRDRDRAARQRRDRVPGVRPELVLAVAQRRRPVRRGRPDAAVLGIGHGELRHQERGRHGRQLGQRDAATSSGSPGTCARTPARSSPTASYTWALRGKDAWGNATAYKTGSFTVDGHAAGDEGRARSTAGANGWIVSPVKVTLTATDKMSGVKSISWRVNEGDVYAYDAVATLTANGVREFQYRAVDKAGVREAWKSMTFKIDTRAPTVRCRVRRRRGRRPPACSAAPVTDRAVVRRTTQLGRRVERRSRVDGGDRSPSRPSPFVVDGDGRPHGHVRRQGRRRQRDAQRRSRSRSTRSRRSLELRPAEGEQPRTVTPNGDGVTATRSRSPSPCPRARRWPRRSPTPAATVVRTFKTNVAGGDARAVDLERARRRGQGPCRTAATR